MSITSMLASDKLQNIIVALARSNTLPIAYMAYGCSVLSEEHPRQGFIGQPRESIDHCYLLGNGSRMYNSVLMRFHSPDYKFSPFSRGGINSYGYARGNPVSFHDRSGRFPEAVTTPSPEVHSTAGNVLRYANYTVNFAGMAAPFQLGARMFRHREVPTRTMIFSMTASFVGGAFGVGAQALADSGIEPQMMTVFSTAAAVFTTGSIWAGQVQSNRDLTAQISNRNSNTSNWDAVMESGVVEGRQSRSRSPESIALKRRSRESTPETNTPLSIKRGSPPGSPPAGPQRLTPTDLGTKPRFF